MPLFATSQKNPSGGKVLYHIYLLREKDFIKIQSSEHQGNTKEEDSLLSSEITSRRALGPESTLKLPQNLCLRD